MRDRKTIGKTSLLDKFKDDLDRRHRERSEKIQTERHYRSQSLLYGNNVPPTDNRDLDLTSRQLMAEKKRFLKMRQQREDHSRLRTIVSMSHIDSYPKLNGGFSLVEDLERSFAAVSHRGVAGRVL